MKVFFIFSAKVKKKKKNHQETGLQVRERLLIATHLDQSNYLANQKYNLTPWVYFRVPASVLVDSLDFE